MWLTLISVGGLAVSSTYVFLTNLHSVPVGDGLYYHYQADLLAEGKGWFIAPWKYLWTHKVVQSAQHPPLWTLVLAAAAFIGLKSYVAQLFWACLVGGFAVFVTGLAAREIAGERAGLIAAAIAAVYPNYWLNIGKGLSEILLLLIVAAVVLVSFQFWHRPSFPKAALLGMLCALAALTRSEQVMLLVVVLVPLALVLRNMTLRRRLALAATGVLVALLVMAPWVGFNLSRFNHPEYLSDESGVTLVAANCRQTYFGARLGYWSFPCSTSVHVSGDESDQDAQYRHVALMYISHHLGRLPVVMAARVGREFGVFAPLSQLEYEHNLRPLVPAQIGLILYYFMVVASVFGAVLLKRRGLTLVPFVGLFVEVFLTAALLFGKTRYRAPLEVGLVVLTAVVLDHLFTPRLKAQQNG